MADISVKQPADGRQSGSPTRSKPTVRTLSAAQKHAIEEACKGAPGQRFELQAISSDDETLAFLDDLKSVLTSAGWSFSPSDVKHAEFSRMPVGVVFILGAWISWDQIA